MGNGEWLMACPFRLAYALHRPCQSLRFLASRSRLSSELARPSASAKHKFLLETESVRPAPCSVLSANCSQCDKTDKVYAGQSEQTKEQTVRKGFWTCTIVCATIGHPLILNKILKSHVIFSVIIPISPEIKCKCLFTYIFVELLLNSSKACFSLHLYQTRAVPLILFLRNLHCKYLHYANLHKIKSMRMTFCDCSFFTTHQKLIKVPWIEGM